MVSLTTGIGIVVLAVVLFVFISWVLALRRIVPPKFADVVTTSAGAKVYSVDPVVTKSAEPRTVYYEFPGWLPKIGVMVRRMPLTIIEIPIKHYKTFSKGNARFVADVSIYCKIYDVLEAAKRFPGSSLEDFIEGIKEIVVSAIRITTANFTVEEVIAHRDKLAEKIEVEIKDDFEKWGVQLTNVAIIDIKDPEKGSTVVHDISAKKEAEINSISRREIAQKMREADIVEAENREKAETRKLEADQKIGERDMLREQKIAFEEQKAKKQQMEVIRTQNVEQAKINAESKKEEAEGTKLATIRVAEGAKQKFELEGKGEAVAIQAKGTSEAEVIKQKGLSEAVALDKLADAQKKQQAFAKTIRTIEKDERIGLEVAKALQSADMKFISAESPKGFMDIFSPSGGLSAGAGLGTLITGLKATDPETYKKIAKLIGSKKLFPKIEEPKK